MNKYAVILLLLSLLVVSGCEVPPENVPKNEMVKYRIVITSIDYYPSNTFTINCVFSRSDAESLDDALSANHDGSKSFHILDWILSPDPDMFTANNNSFSFSLNEGETVPETIVFNTTKPVYLVQTVEYWALTCTAEAGVTVAKAYFETAEFPVTVKD